jgi:hypothetical protein
LFQEIDQRQVYLTFQFKAHEDYDSDHTKPLV